MRHKTREDKGLFDNEPLDKSFDEAQSADLSAINKILDRKLKARAPPTTAPAPATFADCDVHMCTGE